MCVKAGAEVLLTWNIRDLREAWHGGRKNHEEPTGTSRVTIKPVATPGAGTGEARIVLLDFVSGQSLDWPFPGGEQQSTDLKVGHYARAKSGPTFPKQNRMGRPPRGFSN